MAFCVLYCFCHGLQDLNAYCRSERLQSLFDGLTRNPPIPILHSFFFTSSPCRLSSRHLILQTTPSLFSPPTPDVPSRCSTTIKLIQMPSSTPLLFHLQPSYLHPTLSSFLLPDFLPTLLNLLPSLLLSDSAEDAKGRCPGLCPWMGLLS